MTDEAATAPGGAAMSDSETREELLEREAAALRGALEAIAAGETEYPPRVFARWMLLAIKETP